MFSVVYNLFASQIPTKMRLFLRENSISLAGLVESISISQNAYYSVWISCLFALPSAFSSARARFPPRGSFCLFTLWINATYLGNKMEEEKIEGRNGQQGSAAHDASSRAIIFTLIYCDFNQCITKVLQTNECMDRFYWHTHPLLEMWDAI